MKRKYYVENIGSDDSTTFTIKLTKEELKTVLKFINANNRKSDFAFEPEIHIYRFDVNKRGWEYTEDLRLNQSQEQLEVLGDE